MTSVLANDIRNRFVRVAADCLDVDAHLLTPDARFIEELGADSLDVAELALLLEEEFGVQVADERVARLYTVGDAIDYVAQLVGEKHRG